MHAQSNDGAALKEASAFLAKSVRRDEGDRAMDR